jgi:uncharacterized protein involved in exopolysaccharide biosynthesis
MRARGGGVILSFASTPMYSATALLQIQPGGPNILSFEDVQESVALSQAYNDFFQTQYDILASRTLARRTVDDLDLKEDPWLTGEAGIDTISGQAKSWLLSFFSAEDMDPETEELRREHKMLDTFLEHVEIRPRRKSFLVEVSFESPDAKMSSDVADTLAREAGVKAAVLSPLEGLTDAQVESGEDYLSVMRENLAALRKAMECS